MCSRRGPQARGALPGGGPPSSQGVLSLSFHGCHTQVKHMSDHAAAPAGKGGGHRRSQGWRCPRAPGPPPHKLLVPPALFREHADPTSQAWGCLNTGTLHPGKLGEARRPRSGSTGSGRLGKRGSEVRKTPRFSRRAQCPLGKLQARCLPQPRRPFPRERTVPRMATTQAGGLISDSSRPRTHGMRERP